MSDHPRSLVAVSDAIIRCASCPRLVAWRSKVARDKVARFHDAPYWGRPVPGFGDPQASILVVGLAPGAHGANRTGRMFTGDRSGDFLYAALHRASLATQPTSTSADDGLRLHGVFISAAARCAPPDNAPLPEELAACAHFLDDEIAVLPEISVVVALGAIAWRAVLGHLERVGVALPRPRPRFAHGARYDVPLRASARSSKTRVLLGSYHVSQQNTQTRKLTSAMFDEVIGDATRLALRSGLPSSADLSSLGHRLPTK